MASEHTMGFEPADRLAQDRDSVRRRFWITFKQVVAHLPFAEDLSYWVASSDARSVSPRYFIPDNGKKYVLLHDEDYCDHPTNAPAPPETTCLQLNAEAAEADLNAAYFMQRTGNAADATAWMLGTDQVAWIGFRNQSCGIGPGALSCRIRITRQRTRTILKGA